MKITQPEENVQKVSWLNQFISDPNSAKNKLSTKKPFTKLFSFF